MLGLPTEKSVWGLGEAMEKSLDQQAIPEFTFQEGTGEGGIPGHPSGVLTSIFSAVQSDRVHLEVFEEIGVQDLLS